MGAAGLIAVSQLFTYVAPLAQGTPFAIAVLAAAGLVLGRRRLRAIAARWRASAWQLVAPVLAYLLALAPVLLAGRPSFSSYMTLSDSAVHMMGADFLLHHGQNYAHLDLRNSYGLFINEYYNTYYPSGCRHALRRERLSAGPAADLGLPAVQRVHARHRRRPGLAARCDGWAWIGGWAALAALSATLPALVYGYRADRLDQGDHRAGNDPHARRAARSAPSAGCSVAPPSVIPFALVSAAGVSALGVGFGAWVLATAAILARRDDRRDRSAPAAARGGRSG